MSDSKSHLFSLTPSDFSPIFDIHNIREGKSLENLQKLSYLPTLYNSLQTSPTKGISSSSIPARIKVFGKNTPYTRERTGVLEIIWDALHDMVLQILIASAAISLVIGSIQDPATGWIEGVAIMIAVIIVLTVMAVNDYVKDGQFIKLNEETNIHNVIVTRDGKDMEIPVQEVLVGDIVHINPGDVMGVDGILIKGSEVTVDEAMITGESSAVKKAPLGRRQEDYSPLMLSGSQIIEGNGLVLACTVGMNSMMEKVREMSGVVEEAETPLQERLGVFAVVLGKIGIAAGLCIILVLVIYIADDAIDSNEWGDDQWGDLISAFIIGITILVIAVPEGLPLAITLSMAYSIIRMRDENIFVRHIKGCEIMGAATNILSDKTGTLTENKMRAVKALFFEQNFDNVGKIELEKDQLKTIAKVVSRNTTAFFKEDEKGKIEIIGNRTEGALLEMIRSWNFDFHEFRSLSLERCAYAFSSSSKKMTTVYEEDGRTLVYHKGAGEIVVESCKYFLTARGRVEELDSSIHDALSETVAEYSKQELRVIGLAYKEIKEEYLESTTREELEADLVFVGFVGIQDALRPEARESVLSVQKAGVIVRMVTGDNIETAISIAQAAGILPSDIPKTQVLDYVMTGKDFREKTGGLETIKNEKGEITEFKAKDIDSFAVIAKRLRVIARCSPEDKLLLAVGLREMGEVVAVTGDGSNDAAALKHSDIGLAMMSGTQLAKDSSDIILLDDNFHSVVNSVKWGRNVYESTRKFLQFQLIVNVVALAVCIIGAVSVEESPVTAVQMLWVNLIQDSLAALALATEPPTDELLDSRPFGRKESIIYQDMYITIITQSVFHIVILLIILYTAPMVFDIEEGWGNDDWDEDNGLHFTIFFNTFVMLQLFNEINCRKVSMFEVNVFKGFFRDWMFLGVISITFVTQIIFVEFGGEVLKCSPLGLKYHLFCILIGILTLVFGIAVRQIVTWYRTSKFIKATKREDFNDEEEALIPEEN